MSGPTLLVRVRVVSQMPYKFNVNDVIPLTNSMRVDEGRKSWSLVAIKVKARTAVGRGDKAGRRACLVPPRI